MSLRIAHRLKATAILLALLASASGFWLLSSLPQPVQAAPAETFSPYVDEKGNITLPTDYQTTFLHLGTFAVGTKAGKPVDEMHGVYARPEDVVAYQRDGKFPDGAILVKDVYEVKHEPLTTGDAAYVTKVKVWFVMIKDAKGRFPENDLWDDGWGWALFEGKDPKQQVATDYRADCRTCHIPAKQDDWLYVRGYPVLHTKSKNK